MMRGKDDKNLPQLWLEKAARDGKALYDSKTAR